MTNTTELIEALERVNAFLATSKTMRGNAENILTRNGAPLYEADLESLVSALASTQPTNNQDPAVRERVASIVAPHMRGVFSLNPDTETVETNRQYALGIADSILAALPQPTGSVSGLIEALEKIASTPTASGEVLDLSDADDDPGLGDWRRGENAGIERCATIARQALSAQPAQEDVRELTREIRKTIHRFADKIEDEGGASLYDVDVATDTVLNAVRDTLSATPVERWRPEVKAFADLMEAQLRKNDHKGGWKNERPHALLRRLYDEAAELGHAMPYDDDFEPEIVGLEAADVANFAMMIADVCGALPLPPAPDEGE